MPRTLEDVSLLRFFGLSFLIAWGVFIPVGILAPEKTFLVLPGAWAPTIAALLLTWLSGGRAEVRELLGGFKKWRVGFGYYLFAIFGMGAVVLLTIGVFTLLGGSIPSLGEIASRFGLPPDQASLLFAAAPLIYLTNIFVGGPIAEELGWRGYAQPRLQARIGAGQAGLVIGFVWSLWHLPAFFYFPSVVGGVPLVHYIPLITASGVLFAWLYNRTGGSVLLCVLFHAGINFWLGIAAARLLEDPRFLSILVVVVGALAVVLFRRASPYR